MRAGVGARPRPHGHRELRHGCGAAGWVACGGAWWWGGLSGGLSLLRLAACLLRSAGLCTVWLCQGLAWFCCHLLILFRALPPAALTHSAPDGQHSARAAAARRIDRRLPACRLPRRQHDGRTQDPVRGAGLPGSGGVRCRQGAAISQRAGLHVVAVFQHARRQGRRSQCELVASALTYPGPLLPLTCCPVAARWRSLTSWSRGRGASTQVGLAMRDGAAALQAAWPAGRWGALQWGSPAVPARACLATLSS